MSTTGIGHERWARAAELMETHGTDQRLIALLDGVSNGFTPGSEGRIEVQRMALLVEHLLALYRLGCPVPGQRGGVEIDPMKRWQDVLGRSG